MHKKNYFPNLDSIHTLIFDFDGVFTDNNVYVDQNGTESVRCSRADGLGLDLLRKYIFKKKWDLEYFILSKEKNKVVFERAKKLNTKCHYGIDDKLKFLKDYLRMRFPSSTSMEEGVIYLGNDLNDLKIMKFVGFSVSPIDAHSEIIKLSNLTIDRKGGDGFVREFIEKLISRNDSSLEEISTLL